MAAPYKVVPKQVRAGVPDGDAQPTPPGTCPFTLDHPLAEEANARELAAEPAGG